MSRLRAGTVLFTLLLAAWTGCAGPSPQETADLPRPTDADTRPLPDLADAAVPDLLPEARVDRTDGPGDLSGETVDAEPDSGDGGSDVEVASVDSDGDGLTDGEELALGTDPMVEDSDGDGFGDGEEVGLGTDPADPSSALAWQPGWEEGYPRLVFGADEVEALRLKAAEPGKHGATMMGRILAAALSEPAPPKPEAYDAGYEAGRARIAMEAAFLGLLNEDPAYAHKALEIGIHLNPNVDEVGFAHPAYNKTDIHAAETVAYYAKTYDFLRGSGLVSETELGELEAALADLVTRLEQSATKGPLAAMLMLAQNNHNIKTYGAIGLAGIALAHRPEAARWVSRGVTEVRYYFLDYQTTADGGYAEGPNYLVYGMGEAMSLLRAFHRFADGEETYLRHFYDTRETQEMVYEWIPDPLLEPLLHDLFRWPIRLMMPGGLSPNFDDNNLSALPGGYLAALFQDPVFLWHWELPAVNFSSGAGISLAPDILALLDEAMVPQPPDFPPDQLLYEAGNCIFRSDFGETAQYALLLGEHGKIRKHGQGH
jgi:hypothetical protein